MYYLSKYNHITKTENTFLVFNTFTQALADLDESTYNDLIQMNVDSKDKDHFLELGFWVTYNELEKIKAANEQATLNESTLFVVLKMTDACNFRCPYCYQDHIAQFLD